MKVFFLCSHQKLFTGKLITSLTHSQYKLSAKARGKELLITCTAADGIDMQVTICFNHGLVGGWQWTPSSLLPKDARLMFNTSTHSLWYVVMSNCTRYTTQRSANQVLWIQ